MQIICVSKGSQSRGEEFAKKLAEKLGYQCFGREQILEEATKRRIPIGKLETAIIKPYTYTEQLARELEHYKALATSMLCERALDGNIVYHGRTGHLLLPGISHIFKLRVVSESEYRIQYVMQKLQISREKAKRYLEQVEDDRRKWVRNFYNVEWDVFTLYDLVLNLSQMNVENAACATCAMAQLPEFQATPASINALKDLYLGAKARLLLASDKRTNRLNIKIRVNDRVIYITYLIQQLTDTSIICEILQSLKDARELVCTQAQSNILWIQGRFDSNDGSYADVLSLAKKWDAAVELIKLDTESCDEPISALEKSDSAMSDTWRQTGIIDEAEEMAAAQTRDMSNIYEKLINDGRAGGKRTITGCRKDLISSIDRSVNYRLIILDNIFLSKGSSIRKRLLQEWTTLINDSLKMPVISLNEIQSKYKFGPKQLIQMVLTSALTALIVFLLFKFSPDVISFLSQTTPNMKIISTICIVLFIPFFAYLYSTATKLFLRMLKLE